MAGIVSKPADVGPHKTFIFFLHLQALSIRSQSRRPPVWTRGRGARAPPHPPAPGSYPDWEPSDVSANTHIRKQPMWEELNVERECYLGFSCCSSVTPSDGSKTWGRSAVCKKEDLTTSKKKGRTWGPSSTHQKERVGGEEKYGHTNQFWL